MSSITSEIRKVSQEVLASTRTGARTGAAEVSKPFYAVLGAATRAVAQVKTLPAQVKTLPAQVKTLPAQVKTLPAQVKTLPAQVKTLPAGIQRVPEQVGGLPAHFSTMSDRVGERYSELAARGAQVATDLRRRPRPRVGFSSEGLRLGFSSRGPRPVAPRRAPARGNRATS